MTTLLTTDTTAVLRHVLVYVLVAHSSLGVTDTLLIKRFVQTKVGHDSRNHSIGQQLATLFHIAAIDIQDMVASDDITLLVHAQAAVGVTIVGKADIQALLHYELLQTLDVGGASIVVDIQTVRLVIDNVGICTQSIENALSDIPAGTIGAVQADLDTFEGIDTQRDQITHVAVAACHIVHGAADVLTVRKRQLRPVLVKYMELAIDVVLHQQQSLFRHLLAVAVDQLDAVIIVGIVAGRDHDATVKVIHTSDVSYRRRGSNVQQIGVCARSSQTSDQAILEHVRTPTSILADDDTGRVGITIALT